MVNGKQILTLLRNQSFKPVAGAAIQPDAFQEMTSDSNSDMNLGPQPLDGLLDELGLSNHDLVAASEEQITHKMVAKGRKGRRLTSNIQGKLLRALNAAATDNGGFKLSDLFNYEGR